MTRDKVKKESKKEIESIKNKDKVDVQSKKSEEIKEEIKLIEEGPEQKFLEYYSKDDLVKKVAELEDNLKNKEKDLEKLDDWKNKFIHLQAEFENAQKRWGKSRQNLRNQYTAYVLKDFLPFYDSFKKAIENSNENDPINQFYNQFLNILKSQGAELINVNVNDSFDYTIHEALSTVENDDLPENKIVDIIQDGWKFKKDVLRYTKVIISKKPKPPEPEPEKKKEKEVEVEVEKIDDSDSEEKKGDE